MENVSLANQEEEDEYNKVIKKTVSVNTYMHVMHVYVNASTTFLT